MRRCLLIILYLFITSMSLYSQEIKKIVFNHSNAIIIGSGTNIMLEPIENNRKHKVRVQVNVKETTSYYRISQDEYNQICNAILKIENDTIAINTRLIDGSFTIIGINDRDKERTFYASGLSKNDEKDKQRKNYWNAVNLITKAARLRMDKLADYN